MICPRYLDRKCQSKGLNPKSALYLPSISQEHSPWTLWNSDLRVPSLHLWNENSPGDCYEAKWKLIPHPASISMGVQILRDCVPSHGQGPGSLCPSLALSRGHWGPSPPFMALLSEQSWSYRRASTNRELEAHSHPHCWRFSYLGRNKRHIDVFLDSIKRREEYKHKINNLKYVKSTYLKT